MSPGGCSPFRRHSGNPPGFEDEGAGIEGGIERPVGFFLGDGDGEGSLASRKDEEGRELATGDMGAAVEAEVGGAGISDGDHGAAFLDGEAADLGVVRGMSDGDGEQEEEFGGEVGLWGGGIGAGGRAEGDDEGGVVSGGAGIGDGVGDADLAAAARRQEEGAGVDFGEEGAGGERAIGVGEADGVIGEGEVGGLDGDVDGAGGEVEDGELGGAARAFQVGGGWGEGDAARGRLGEECGGGEGDGDCRSARSCPSVSGVRPHGLFLGLSRRAAIRPCRLSSSA